MIDINAYRMQIGYFNQYNSIRKSASNCFGIRSDYIAGIFKIPSLLGRRRSFLCRKSKNKYSIKNFVRIRKSGMISVMSVLATSIIIVNSYSKSTGQECSIREFSSNSLVTQEVYILPKVSLTLNGLLPNLYAKMTHGNTVNQKRGIKNAHLNIRSLNNKLTDVKILAKEEKPHIFGISECEIRKDKNNHFDEKKLKVPGYNTLYPKSWSIHGYARILLYVKTDFEYQQLHDLEEDIVQSIWIKGSFKNQKKILFCHAYREHTSSMGNSLQSQRQYLQKFLEQWEVASEMKMGNEPYEIHISGDMNLDSLDGKWFDKSYHLYSLSELVQKTSNSCNFTQIVKGPTRFQFNSVQGSTSKSCIDHVYTNQKFRCSPVTITPFGNSDHDLISYIRYAKNPPAHSRVIRRRSYKDFKLNDFLLDLNSVNWSSVYASMDVDLAVSAFTIAFREVLDKHAPWIKYQKRKKYSPWVSKETINLMKDRDKAKQYASNLAKNGLSSADAWLSYKTLRNKINNKLKYEENRYKQGQIKSTMNSPSDCWSMAKSFMNWNDSSGPPTQLLVNGQLLSKPAQLANEMNSFFMEKIKNIRKDMPSLSNTFSECYHIMRGKSSKLWLQHVSVQAVTKLLKTLSNSKSVSIDGLDSYSVKVSAEIIAKPVHHIVTLSIMQSKFPDTWKYSKVIPLFKKGSKLERQNYRPVAILSPVSKVLEKIIYKQIYDYFTRNKLLHENLHGYRQNRSTQTALLTMYDRWIRAASSGHLSGVLLIDLSATFDLVDHNLLLKKLKYMAFKMTSSYGSKAI